MKTKDTDSFVEQFTILIEKILKHPDIIQMSFDDLELYAEKLLKILFSKVRSKMSEKQDLAVMLDKMTNEEFYQYMQDKYGPKWILVTILPEELDRCPVISEEEIEELLRQGAEDARRAEANMPNSPKW